MQSTDLLEFVSCNLCGSDQFEVIYPARYDLERVPDLGEKFKSSGDERLIDQVVECKRCNLRYVNPRLRTDVIVQSYSEGTDENFVSQSAAREATFDRQLRKIEKYVSMGRVLDIGTAGGSFLAVAKRHGWTVDGIEPNKWLVKWCKKKYGLEIKEGTLENQMYPETYFDLITLWDVLEHTGSPKDVLKQCARILKKQGLLVVNVPDVDSAIHKIMGRRWAFYLSVHLYYFSKATIKEMLQRQGFEVLSMKPHFQTLGLGYLLFRLQAYSKTASKVGTKLANALGISRIQIPYWLGQTLVIARKK